MLSGSDNGEKTDDDRTRAIRMSNNKDSLSHATRKLLLISTIFQKWRGSGMWLKMSRTNLTCHGSEWRENATTLETHNRVETLFLNHIHGFVV